MPKPPANRKHGTGDRNDDDVAKVDHHLQDRRNDRREEDAEQADRQAERDTGHDRPGLERP